MAEMEATQVNWDLLDALVINYAEEEQLFTSENDEFFCQGGALRSTIQDIRSLIELGHINKAYIMIMEHAPEILHDNRLLFQLYKQEFIELLRNGSIDAQNEAINHSRMQLGPCALNAYPEAYEEFKRILLALIYDACDGNSPVALEWSEGRRLELAATISSTLKAHLHAYEPPFSLIIRYLIRLHNAYCIRQNVASPIADIAGEILLKERDPPTNLQDSLLSIPDLHESDVQALAQGVDISRQAAVDSLRYTRGDLNNAMKNELSRMRMDVPMMDELVHEYCIYRGLLAGDANMLRQQASSSEEFQQDSTIDSSASTGSVFEEAATMVNWDAIFIAKNGRSGDVAYGRQYVGAVPAAELSATDSEGEVIQAGTSHGNEISALQHNLQIDNRSGAMSEDKGKCSEVHDHVAGAAESDRGYSGCGVNKILVANHLKAGQEVSQIISSRCRRKKWKGRSGSISSASLKGLRETVTKFDQSPAIDFLRYSDEMLASSSNFDKYEMALRIRKAVMERSAKEAIEEIESLLPSFFDINPSILFQLKQLEFLSLLKSGELESALHVARQDLGPLAARSCDLLQPLKDTLLALVELKEELFSYKIMPLLVSSLQVALNSQLGIVEPKLMKIMRVTLFMHTEWFKLQRCLDPFGELLKINALKDTEAFSSTSSRADRSDIAGVSCSQIAGSTVSSRPSEGSISQQPDFLQEQANFDETAVLTISEWLAFSRADAIQLLAQYDGNLDSVFEHVIP